MEDVAKRERAAAVLAARMRRLATADMRVSCADCAFPARFEAEIRGQHDERRPYCPSCYALRMHGLGGAARG